MALDSKARKKSERAGFASGIQKGPETGIDQSVGSGNRQEPLAGISAQPTSPRETPASFASRTPFDASPPARAGNRTLAHWAEPISRNREVAPRKPVAGCSRQSRPARSCFPVAQFEAAAGNRAPVGQSSWSGPSARHPSAVLCKRWADNRFGHPHASVGSGCPLPGGVGFKPEVGDLQGLRGAAASSSCGGLAASGRYRCGFRPLWTAQPGRADLHQVRRQLRRLGRVRSSSGP